MTEATNDTQPSSTEPPIDAATELVQNVSNDSTAAVAAVVAIPAEIHAEAQSVFASLVSKLENFEHALAADAKAELEKLKALLHL